MKLDFPNTPTAVLSILKKQLEEFGAFVHFETPTRGTVVSIAGQLAFEHKGRRLTILVTDDQGHFPKSLLIGGIKQMVSEAREQCEAVA
jgi:hypothetical protein